MTEQPAPLPDFSDPDVEAVYELLCDLTPAPGDEHREGWMARRIVGRLRGVRAAPSAEALTETIRRAASDWHGNPAATRVSQHEWVARAVLAAMPVDPRVAELEAECTTALTEVEIADGEIERLRAAAVASSSSLPWQAGPLALWSIVGMNHYYVTRGRRLFVAMTRDNICIKAEGADEAMVFAELEAEARMIDRALADAPPAPAAPPIETAEQAFEAIEAMRNALPQALISDQYHCHPEINAPRVRAIRVGASPVRFLHGTPADLIAEARRLRAEGGRS